MKNAEPHFDNQPILSSNRLNLRPLEHRNLEGLYSAANDPEIWAQHPESDRYMRDVFDVYFDFLLNVGGTLVATNVESGDIIGCSRFYPVPDHPGEFGIGFTFLARAYWGGAWNQEMKVMMIRHVLHSQDRVWFHIGPDNIRSQIATTRIGAQFESDTELALSGTPTLMKCYTLTRANWENATGKPL